MPTTIDDLHQAFRVARHNWLTVAEAIKRNWDYYGFLEPDVFLEETKINLSFIEHMPSLKALQIARTAAQVLLIAEEQGLNKAMIWKLCNA